MDDPAAVDAYLARVPEPHRTLLTRIRALVREACPDATETISYGMPAFRLNGRMLVWYAAHRRHCSMYPASGRLVAELGGELAPFLGAKATIRFTVERPLADGLVRRIVAARVAEGEAARVAEGEARDGGR